MYILFVFQFLIKEVICNNQWNILEVTVQQENIQLFFSCNGNLCSLYYYNITYMSLRFITIVVPIPHSLLYGFAGRTLHFDSDGSLWRKLHYFGLWNN